MLLRKRTSRIYFLRRFFDYPIRLTLDTLGKLGLARTVRIGFSYLRSLLFPIRTERTLEEFFINRFGRELYRTFFKDYTEKVWGVPCGQISAEWGRQRIKGLSIAKSIQHFLRQLLRPARRHRAEGHGDIAHRAVPLPEVRARPDVGRGGAQGRREGRGNPDGMGGQPDPHVRAHG